MSHWIIHSTVSFKNTDSFRNKTCNCLYKWVNELFTQLIYSKTLITSETKPSDYIFLTHPVLTLINLGAKQVSYYKWVTEWFTQLIHLKHQSIRNKASDSLMDEWLHFSFDQFVQNTDLLRNWISDLLWSLNLLSHWIFNLTDSLKHTYHMLMTQGWVNDDKISCLTISLEVWSFASQRKEKTVSSIQPHSMKYS